MVSATMPQMPRSLGHVTPGERAILQRAAELAASTGKIDLGQLRGASKVFLLDVEEASLRFFHQLALLTHLGRECPFVELEQGIKSPLDIVASMPAGISHNAFRSISGFQVVTQIRIAKMIGTQAGLKVKLFDGPSARTAFSSLLTGFLQQRVESSRGTLKGVVSGSGGSGNYPGLAISPGLNLKVSTRASGLQVLYAPAFFVSLQTVFGNSLSTPVVGTIIPGTYVFGAQGTSTPATFEKAMYAIPPTTHVNMLSV